MAELPVPSRALTDPQGREILRVWIAHGSSMAMVDHREFGLGLEAIKGWSGILGHVAATVAHSVAQEAGELDRDALVERMAGLLTAELRLSLNEMTATTREVH